ncbi:Glycogen synthase, ADP-glucose transglucosylase [hydrothermal vent metagenome]|uniref:starch synthase n=1 Tax=hydrothermal vent metagenome TaxID=652676 RepID=A0A3B0ZH87_9ZZZZ
MDILFCTSEAYPLIKTGGLADVSGSLPKALLQLEHDIRLVLPAYPAVLQRVGARVKLAELNLTGCDRPVRILISQLPNSEVPLYLIDAPGLFDRPGNPYTQADGTDWPDNAERFALFARACVALALGEADHSWQPQLVHCNDWQTGLVPALLSLEPQRPATLFSIHNLAYQGLFTAKTFGALNLPDALWSLESLEFYNLLSFIKGGIAHADWVTTVSPGYAEEIIEPAHGYGLDGLLRHRYSELTGIINGVDGDTWGPANDPLITRRYDVHTLQNKLFNKFTLQRDMGLTVASQPLMLSYVGRIAEQKGIDMIFDIMEELFKLPVQLVMLGSGDPKLEVRLRAAEQHYPRQLAVHIGYDEPLAHHINAGADALLIPSRYEPCGLNQMYSQLYGTLPIAHCTGGLADTIVNFTQQSLDAHKATGFLFDDDTPEALLATCLAALSLYRNSRTDWWKMVIAGMKQDFSWTQSARQYEEIYSRLVNRGQHDLFQGRVGKVINLSEQPSSQHILH